MLRQNHTSLHNKYMSSDLKRTHNKRVNKQQLTRIRLEPTSSTRFNINIRIIRYHTMTIRHHLPNRRDRIMHLNLIQSRMSLITLTVTRRRVLQTNVNRRIRIKSILISMRRRLQLMNIRRLIRINRPANRRCERQHRFRRLRYRT